MSKRPTTDDPVLRAAGERLGDAPIQEEYRAQMNGLAAAIDRVFNGDAQGSDRAVGFVLLTFPFGDHDRSRCNFISNGADRRDLVALFREMAARFESQPNSRGGTA